MRVDWAAICRYCEVVDGLFTMVGAGIDRFRVNSCPAQVQVNIALRMAGLPDAARHSMALRVLDPQLQEIASSSGTFGLNPNPNLQPGWEATVNQPLMVVFVAQQAGAYAIDINVDGSSRTLVFLVDDQP